MPDSHAPSPILLVDHDPAVLAYLITCFEKQGLPTLTYNPEKDPRAALIRPFSLLVANLVLPGQNGLALAEELRTVRPGLPFILHTAYLDPAILSHAQARGAAAVITNTGKGSQVCRRLTEEARKALPIETTALPISAGLPEPKVMDYNHPVLYLKHHFEHRKILNPKISHGAFANLTGLGSRKFVWDLFHDQRSLTDTHLYRFLERVKDPAKAKEFFYNMTRYFYARDDEPRTFHLTALRELNPYFVPPPPREEKGIKAKEKGRDEEATTSEEDARNYVGKLHRQKL